MKTTGQTTDERRWEVWIEQSDGCRVLQRTTYATQTGAERAAQHACRLANGVAWEIARTGELHADNADADETVADWYIEPAASGPMTVSASELLAALKRVKHGIASRSAIPVLSGVLFNGATLTTKDLTKRVDVTTNVLASGGLEIVAPLALLEKILGKCGKTDNVTLSTRKTTLTVASGSRTFTLEAWPVSDFPVVHDGPVSSVQALPFWHDAWSRLKSCLSRDEKRPLLCGFRMDGATIAATDSYRLGVYRVPDDIGASLPPLTIPARVGDIVAKLKGSVSFGVSGAADPSVVKCDLCKGKGTRTHREYGPAGDIKTTACPVCHGLGTVLERHEGTPAFMVDDGAGHVTTVVGEPIDGDYPNWRVLVREHHDATATVDRAALLDAVDAVSVLAQKNGPVRLAFSLAGTLRISTSSQDIGSAEETLAIDYSDDAEPMEIGFNPAYLADALSALTGPRVEFGLSNPLRPAVITDASDNGSGHMFLSLLMPIRLAS